MRKIKPVAVEEYSLQYARHATNAFFSGQEIITGKQILSFCAVRQVNLFIMHQLFTTWQTEAARLRSPYFDYQSTEVREAMQQFMRTLSQQIAVRKKEFEPLAIGGVSATLRLLLAPYDYLSDVLRNSGQGTSLTRLRDLSRYVQINKSLLLDVIRQLEETGQTTIASDEAMAALDKVYPSHEATLENDAEYVAQFSTSVPLRRENLLIEDLAPAPEWSLSPEHFMVDIEQFVSAASGSNSPVSKPVTPAPPVAPELPTVNVPIESTATPELLQPPVKPAYPSTEPVKPKPVQSVEPAKSANLNEKFVREQVTLNDRLKRESPATLLDRHQQTRIQSIKSAISLNQRFLFTAELFGGDSSTFNQALSELDQSADYPSAMHLLTEKYAQKYTWQADSEIVTEFYEIVRRKF